MLSGMQWKVKDLSTLSGGGGDGDDDNEVVVVFVQDVTRWFSGKSCVCCLEVAKKLV